MSEAGKGVAAMLGACLVWGLSGIFFKALGHVPPLEVLAHRTLWSVLVLGAMLAWQRRGAELRAALTGRVLAVLAVTACLIAANWLGFIYAVQAGRALEASLGYYIFPLVAVALGFLVLGERFSALQAAAIGLAAAAVLLLTVGLGAAPWIALVLAATFGGYGLLKKRLPLGPVASVAIEAGLLAPLALGWLVALHGGWAVDPSAREGAWFGRDGGTTALLILSGPLMTAGPLFLFSYAARRVQLATVGLVQYLNPTLQFAVAVAIFGELFTPWHALAFPMIWAGLALYSWESWRGARAARSRAISAGTVS